MQIHTEIPENKFGQLSAENGEHRLAVQTWEETNCFVPIELVDSFLDQNPGVVSL